MSQLPAMQPAVCGRPVPRRSRHGLAKLTLTMLLLLVAQPYGARAQAAESQRRPNIILIMADDIGYECFGCYGSRQYKTPHIDQMARDGMRFTHCYSQPLCTPSRIKLMTGLSNVRNYAAFSVLRQDQRTIGRYFQAAGYETLVAGKWQLLAAEHYPKQFRGKGSWPSAAGFDHVCLWQVDRLGDRYWKPLLYVDGTNRQFGADEYGPDVAARYITEFIRQPHEKPFFIYYPMILVHDPFQPTPQSESRQSRNKQRNFEDMVVAMDRIVGQIIQTTREQGLADDTLILFTGDNGTNKAITSELNGRSFQGGKGKLTDDGTRVPLVALWPGTVPAGQVCEDLVDFSDFLPTTLSAAGASIPEGLDGQSFLPQLKGQPGTPREWIFCFYCPRPERSMPQRFVRDKRFKLYGDGRFVDVSRDVEEKRALDVGQLDETAARAHRKLQTALESMPAEGQMLLRFE